MYPPPPPELEKLKQDRATTDVPPPQNDKVGFQVKVTFWFWLMYPPPPRIGKVEATTDVPPPE